MNTASVYVVVVVWGWWGTTAVVGSHDSDGEKACDEVRPPNGPK